MSDNIQDIKQDFENAIMSPEEIEREIAGYEKQHGFSTQKLLEMQAEGTLPDTFDIQMWLTLLKYR